MLHVPLVFIWKFCARAIVPSSADTDHSLLRGHAGFALGTYPTATDVEFAATTGGVGYIAPMASTIKIMMKPGWRELRAGRGSRHWRVVVGTAASRSRGLGVQVRCFESLRAQRGSAGGRI